MQKDYMSLRTHSKLSSEKDSPKTVAEAVFLLYRKAFTVKQKRMYICQKGSQLLPDV